MSDLAVLAYREWAQDAASFVSEDYAELEAHLLTHPPTIDIKMPIFAVGWSEKITPLPGSEWFIVHPSRLPKYRGGSPIQHQILHRNDWIWVSIFKLTDADAPMDSGPIAWQSMPLPCGPAYSLDEILGRITEATVVGIATVARQIHTGTLILTPQDESQATSYRRRTPPESQILPEDFREMSARRIHDQIRALQDPYPNAFIVCADGKRLYLTGSHLEDDAE